MSQFYSMTSEGNLSYSERLDLVKTIGRLPDAQFEQLVCALKMPPENKPGSSAAKGDKASNLIGWAESPVGPGLAKLQEVLNQVLGKEPAPPAPPPDSFFAEDLGNGVTLEMIRIPEGRFWMGSPENEEGSSDEEGPRHRVNVSSFFMGKYPVTQRQWQAVSLLDDVGMELEPDPSYFKGDNRPVERVSWDDAVEFCKRLSKHSGKDYRLPSEAEWEYACRAGTMSPYYFGKEISDGLANYGEHYKNYGEHYKGTTEVGKLGANAFGLYGVHGNVWEWCIDYWHNNYDGASVDGSAWIEGGDFNLRVLRGGSWGSDPRLCRSAYRGRLDPVTRNGDLGFRVCCSPPRTP